MKRSFCFFSNILLPLAMLFVTGVSYADSDVPDSLMREGDSLHLAYRFELAREAYEAAIAQIDQDEGDDSSMFFALTDRILKSENAVNMSRYAQKPKVLARRKFSIDAFYLYYPLEDHSWRKLPNQLDSVGHDMFSRALYAPDWDDSIYYSAYGEDGVRNIYFTEYQDTIWTAPALAGTDVTSGYNEIYPMLSPDGKRLYFSSRGFYGIGGYDLYMSEWNAEKESWSAPRNMGFPYSSPADDFLFVESDDGRYSLFASNRECQKDSVYVYVLEYETYPVHVPVENPDELRKLSRLEPVREAGARNKNEADFPDNDLTRDYMDKMSRVRSLRDSISDRSLALEGLRTDFAFSNDPEERSSLTGKILRIEADIPRLQDVLDKANAELRSVEMEFLKKGVFINHDILDEADGSDPGSRGYEFRKRSLGGPLDIKIAAPEEKFDYAFMVLDEGRFAPDQELPSGVVYQIQMYGSAKKAEVKDLRGLSPVYESVSGSGMYVYRAGRMSSFKEAAACIERVKRQGFRSAYITAFVDGREVPVAKARALEANKSNAPLFYQVRIVPAGGELEPSFASDVSEKSAGKDLARTEREDGTVIFVVGPFKDKAEADEVAEFAASAYDCEVSVELFGNELTNK